MKYLAAALVTIALMVPMVMGDLGYFDANDRTSYDFVATVALVGFAWLVGRRDGGES